MNQLEKLREGCICPKCRAGTLTLEAKVPLPRRPGMSESRFRCTACGAVMQQVEDDRFSS
jgi:rubredoxin